MMFIDKQKAIRHRWRIAEKSLFFIAIIGGSIGVWLGMYLCHHKTQHWYFKYGIPCVVLMQVILFAMIYKGLLRV